MDKRYSKVFKPGTFPDITYVSRKSGTMQYSYEERLQQSLSIDGFLTYIVGPSKIGKTVLCERVIGIDRIVAMSGNDFVRESDFWNRVAKKIGISTEAEISETNADFSSNEQRSTMVKKNYPANKEKILQYFKESNKVLVLDDFHYAPAEVQYDIACQLKEVIRLGFKAVIISLPYRSDDAIRLNPDLTGRLSVIEIEPWKEKELQAIARKGFHELGISLQEDIPRTYGSGKHPFTPGHAGHLPEHWPSSWRKLCYRWKNHRRKLPFYLRKSSLCGCSACTQSRSPNQRTETAEISAGRRKPQRYLQSDSENACR